jgi:hypothetical protein
MLQMMNQWKKSLLLSIVTVGMIPATYASDAVTPATTPPPSFIERVTNKIGQVWDFTKSCWTNHKKLIIAGTVATIIVILCLIHREKIIAKAAAKQADIDFKHEFKHFHAHSMTPSKWTQLTSTIEESNKKKTVQEDKKNFAYHYYQRMFTLTRVLFQKIEHKLAKNKAHASLLHAHAPVHSHPQTTHH